MKDYEITVRIKNARMLSKMRECGIETANELARRSGVANVTVGLLLNIKLSALKRTGELRKSVEKICEILRCLPEDIIPPQHFENALQKNSAKFEASLDDIESLGASLRAIAIPADKQIERSQAHQAIVHALMDLTERERTVLDRRFGLTAGSGESSAQISSDLRVSAERIRQIEMKALRKLKHPSRIKLLSEAYDTICCAA